jgi:hypothetical protein
VPAAHPVRESGSQSPVVPPYQDDWSAKARKRRTIGAGPKVSFTLEITDVGRDPHRRHARQADNQQTADHQPAYLTTCSERIAATCGRPNGSVNRSTLR